MPSLFLDKGVVLGFCYPVEIHHIPCREYLEDEKVTPYLTEEVANIFAIKRSELTDRYSNAVLEHTSEIRKRDGTTEFGPQDQQEIRRSIPDSNPARDFLVRWYDSELPQFISQRELAGRLRNLARDIDQIAVNRKKELDDMVNVWERTSEYPEVESALSEIKEDKEEDLWICIDAHDLAVRTDGVTELGTTDLDDLVRDGRKQLILEATAIDDVVPLAGTDP